MSSINAIFEHAEIGIIIVSKKGVIEEVNPYANKIFGYNEKELVGKKIEILVPQNIKDKHISYRENYAKRPEPRAMGVGRDLNAVRKSGEVFPVEVSLCSYLVNNEKKLVSFVNDITVRKKSELELRAVKDELENKVEERTSELSQALVELHHTNQNLEANKKNLDEALKIEKHLNEMKSRFVSMASHEFRTPLAGVLSSVNLISKYTTTETNDKRLKHIDRIKKSVHHLTSILNDFLSLDKLEEGVVKLNISQFNLNDFFEDIISETKEILEGQNLVVQNKLQGDVLLNTDFAILKNIFLNLLSNAIKYSESDSNIYIEIEASTENNIEVTITDEGVGIPEQEQKQMFSRFFRAENVTNIQGTGLGLNIVKRYLDLLDGSISFSSKLNEGTRFKLKIPMRSK